MIRGRYCCKLYKVGNTQWSWPGELERTVYMSCTYDECSQSQLVEGRGIITVLR